MLVKSSKGKAVALTSAALVKADHKMDKIQARVKRMEVVWEHLNHDILFPLYTTIQVLLLFIGVPVLVSFVSPWMILVCLAPATIYGTVALYRKYLDYAPNKAVEMVGKITVAPGARYNARWNYNEESRDTGNLLLRKAKEGSKAAQRLIDAYLSHEPGYYRQFFALADTIIRMLDKIRKIPESPRAEIEAVLTALCSDMPTTESGYEVVRQELHDLSIAIDKQLATQAARDGEVAKIKAESEKEHFKTLFQNVDVDFSPY